MVRKGLQDRASRKALIVAGLLGLALALGACHDNSCPTPDLSQVPLLDDGEKSTLAAYLSTHADLRLPQESECGCDDALAREREQGPDYQPYIARGDFNGDGEEDFAVLLVKEREDGAPTARLVIFNGPFSGYSPPGPAAEFPSGFGKYLALFSRNGQLLMGQFESDGCTYQPGNDGTGYIQNCGDED